MQLQLSLQEICDFFTQHSDLVYASSVDGVITYASDNSSLRLGYSSDEIIGRHFTDFVHPDDLDTARGVYENASRCQKPAIFNFGLRLIHKDGRSLHFDFTTHAVIKDGTFHGTIGVGRDVTTEITTKAALGMSEERYRVLIENANDIIYTVAPDGIVSSVNPFVKNITDWEPEEIIGKHFTFFMHPDERQHAMHIHQMIAMGQKPPRFELRFLKKNGEYLNAEFSITPLFHEGRFWGTLGIGRDVTDRIIAEINLRNSLEKEKQLNELKQQFISIASHEFRNPLTLIGGTAELLGARPEIRSNEYLLKGLSRIRDNVKRMAAMLDNVTFFAYDECKGGPEAANEKIVIAAFCSDIVEDVHQLTEKRNRINFTCIEPITPDSTIIAKREHLRHILLNLLTNAVKYSPEGEDIDFKLLEENGQFVFVITDKGIGIPENDIQNLFHNFSRASNVGNIKGTGMGLSIVKKCVDMHGGKIALESLVNKGTRVTVKIPARRA